MDLSDWKDFIGEVAVLMTVIQFLSGALVCKQYVLNKTTGETSSLPFVCCALSCSLWLLYGLMKVDDKIVIVNLIGISLMVAYTVVFYIYSIKKSLVVKQCIVAMLVFFSVVGYIGNQNEKATIKYCLGITASFFTIAAISSPMSKLFHVIKVRSTECLPFPLILMSFVVSSLWTLYGYASQDSFLVCVNILGTLLSVVQLLLFCIFPAESRTPLLPKNI